MQITIQLLTAVLIVIGAPRAADASIIVASDHDGNFVSVIDGDTFTELHQVPAGRPQAVAIHPSGKLAYVANNTGDNVSVIDLENFTVLDTLPIPGGRGLAVHPNGSRLYASHRNDFTVFDLDSNTVTNTLPIRSRLAMHPDGRRLIMADGSGGPLRMFDTVTDTVTAEIPVPHTMWDLAIHPNGRIAYVCDYPPISETSGGGVVSAIDLETETLITTITNLPGSTQVAVHPNGRWLYVTQRDAGTFTIIDTETYGVIDDITGLNRPAGLAVDPNGQAVYVGTSNALLMIDPETHLVVGQMPGITASDIAVLATDTPRVANGSIIVASDFDGDSVSVIDGNTLTELARIPVGEAPQGVAIHPSGKLAYVANRNDDNVSVIDLESLTVVDTLAIPGGRGLVAHPNGSRLYACHREDFTVFDLDANTVVTNLPFRARLVMHPDGRRLVAANTTDGGLTVFDTVTDKVMGPVIPVPHSMWDLAIHPNGRIAYVNDFPPISPTSGGGVVSAIDLETGTLITTITNLPGSTSVAVHPNGRWLYVTQRDAGMFTVIDTETYEVVAELTGLTAPGGLAVEPSGRSIYVGVSGALLVIDPKTNLIVGQVPGVASGNIAILATEPIIHKITSAAGGTMRVEFSALPNLPWSVYATSDFGESVLLGTGEETSPGRFQFTDTHAEQFPQRFYFISGQ